MDIFEEFTNNMQKTNWCVWIIVDNTRFDFPLEIREVKVTGFHCNREHNILSVDVANDGKTHFSSNEFYYTEAAAKKAVVDKKEKDFKTHLELIIDYEIPLERAKEMLEEAYK